MQCYGCGLCRDVCKPDAIGLVDRATLPALVEVW
jgi:Pyruvate/2-oxoacid:ferredoxin oxidoreductase delta subunit